MQIRVDSSDAVFDYAVDLRKLIKYLDYSDEETSEAARSQPKLFLLAAIYRVQKLRKRQRREAKLKLLRSQLAKEIRLKMSEEGERVTDKQVEERISRRVEYVKLSKLLDNAIEEEEFAKLLNESYRQRSSSLKISAELIGAEVYVSRKMEGTGDTELTQIRKRLNEKYGGQVIREKKRRND